MNRFFIKLEFFLKFYKSKFLKKKIFNFQKEENFKNQLSQYKFNELWFFNNIEIINYFLPRLKDIEFNYLEVGSHEGMSLLNVLTQYKNVQATSIDIWSDNIIEKTFDENLKHFKNCNKIKQDSIAALRKLKNEDKKFDYIFIDGCHEGDHILIDAIQAFKILKINGIMIFDDFMQHDEKLKHKSYEGIYYFLKLFKKEIKILYFQNILIIKKN
jgi:hypothetical protein